MNQLYRELRQHLAATLAFAPDKPEETADSTLHALWHTAAGVPYSATRAMTVVLPELDFATAQTLRMLISKRLSGIPLAHITGRQHFFGMELLAEASALVPRKETELLAGAAVQLATTLAATSDQVLVIDVCTGSGNVALAVASQVPKVHVYAADLSDDAVALARRNARHLDLQTKVEFYAGDLLVPFDNTRFWGCVDVLTCNPPYISSGKVGQMAPEITGYEPHLAFDGGPFGVSLLMRLLQDAPRFLRKSGWLAFEVGLGQGPGMMKRLEKSPGVQAIRAIEDERDAIRVLLAQY